MRTRCAFIMLLLTIWHGWTAAYEDNTHQRLTDQAIKVAEEHGLPSGFFTDPEKQAIIDGAGRTPAKWNAARTTPEDENAGEDYTSYTIKPCWLVDKSAEGSEPLNHFGSKMLEGGPAYETIIRFYWDAVRLWKHGRRAEAAFILGRAVHLVEDMGQPQHALNERHYPYRTFWVGTVAREYNPSFLEEFTEAHIKDLSGVPTTLAWDFCQEDGEYPDYSTLIGGLGSFGCQFCSQPQDFIFDMEHVAVTQRAPGGGFFTLAQLRQWFPGRQFDAVSDRIELPFQFVGAPCGTKEYRESRDYRWDDFSTARINSIDLGFRLKEAQSEPVAFAAWHTDTLLRPAVADAANLIVSFWNEVKNAPSPESLPPCQSKPAGAGGGPARDAPDDSLQVKASTPPASAEPSASDSWQDVCRVGISKGLPSMADYGVSSSIFDQLAALGANADPAIAEALYARLETLEAKYSGPQNLMPQDVKDAPGVAVWMSGSGESARALIESFREPVRTLEEPEEPVFTDEQSLAALPPKRGLLDADPAKQRVLVLPTGSLYGLRTDSVERPVLQDFVERGGVVVSFTQPFGEDFSALPVPAGQELIAVGCDLTDDRSATILPQVVPA